jgi:hypothetical protein
MQDGVRLMTVYIVGNIEISYYIYGAPKYEIKEKY